MSPFVNLSVWNQQNPKTRINCQRCYDKWKIINLKIFTQKGLMFYEMLWFRLELYFLIFCICYHLLYKKFLFIYIVLILFMNSKFCTWFLCVLLSFFLQKAFIYFYCTIILFINSNLCLYFVFLIIVFNIKSFYLFIYCNSTIF